MPSVLQAASAIVARARGSLVMAEAPTPGRLACTRRLLRRAGDAVAAVSLGGATLGDGEGARILEAACRAGVALVRIPPGYFGCSDIGTQEEKRRSAANLRLDRGERRPRVGLVGPASLHQRDKVSRGAFRRWRPFALVDDLSRDLHRLQPVPRHAAVPDLPHHDGERVNVRLFIK